MSRLYFPCEGNGPYVYPRLSLWMALDHLGIIASESEVPVIDDELLGPLVHELERQDWDRDVSTEIHPPYSCNYDDNGLNVRLALNRSVQNLDMRASPWSVMHIDKLVDELQQASWRYFESCYVEPSTNPVS